MRNLGKLIDQMQKEIPEGKTLRDTLEYLKGNLAYTAPELLPNMFHEVGTVIQISLPYPPSEDWQWKLIAIWMDKPETELRKNFK